MLFDARLFHAEVPLGDVDTDLGNSEGEGFYCSVPLLLLEISVGKHIRAWSSNCNNSILLQSITDPTSSEQLLNITSSEKKHI